MPSRPARHERAHHDLHVLPFSGGRQFARLRQHHGRVAFREQTEQGELELRICVIVGRSIRQASLLSAQESSFLLQLVGRLHEYFRSTSQRSPSSTAIYRGLRGSRAFEVCTTKTLATSTDRSVAEQLPPAPLFMGIHLGKHPIAARKIKK